MKRTPTGHFGGSLKQDTRIDVQTGWGMEHHGCTFPRTLPARHRRLRGPFSLLAPLRRPDFAGAADQAARDEREGLGAPDQQALRGGRRKKRM